MKLKRLCIILTLLLVWNGTLVPTIHAADPPVGPPVAPGQVPDGLSAAEWETIQEQVRGTEDHYARQEASTPYPLAVNSLLISLVDKVIADDGRAGDVLGYPMALSGGIAVIGAHRADVGGNTDQGAAYVFYRDQGGADAWGQVAKLTAADGTTGDYFGNGVAIDGDTVVVGAYQDDGIRGAAYVFYRDQGGTDNWGQVKKLTASDGGAGHRFGLRVSINGDTVVVGSRHAQSDRGAAYVFYRNQGGVDNWGQVKKLVASDGAASDWFGHRVSASGDTIVVTAVQADVSGNVDQGAAYVFYRDRGGVDNWGQVKKLTASDGTSGDIFGSEVSMSGDTLLVGAAHANIGGKNDQGAAYVFHRDQGGANNWGQVTKLSALDGAAGDKFGCDVSVSGDTIVVGARHAAVEGNGDQGAVYIFQRDQGGADAWGQAAKLTAADGAAGDWYGISVSVSRDTVVVGAQNVDIGGNDDQGAAYVYRLTYQAYLPLVLRNYGTSGFRPLHIGDPIPTRHADHQGEVFYTQVLKIPGQLPSSGKFYFSSQPNVVAEVLVDDELVILSGGVEVYSYNFSSSGSPTPAILEAPRSMVEGLAGKTVSIEYRDVYGSMVEASDMWLIWVP